MRRTVLIILAVAVVLLVSGCSLFEKSIFAIAGDTTFGWCFQVTTSDIDLRNSLINAGYQEGTCANNGFAGSHYCSDSSGSGAGSYDVNVYYGSDFDNSDIQAACTGSGWTYH